MEKKRERFGILVTSSHLSGAEKRALKLYSFLRRQGEDCSLILNEDLFKVINQGSYQKYLEEKVFVYDHWNFSKKILNQFIIRLGLPRQKLFDRLNKERVRKYAIKNDLSFIHVFLDTNFGSIPEIKTIFEITSPDKVNEILFQKEKFDLENSIFNAVSESVFFEAKKLLPIEKLKLAPVPFFIPPEEIVDFPKLLKKKEKVILFAHRFIPRKNAILFAFAVKDFLKENIDWKIKFFGIGPEKPSIEHLLKDEIQNGFVEIGHTSSLFTELKKSKIFVSLIQPDNYPSQSIFEAMYAGNALLLSDTGSSREKFFKDNGVLCDLDPNTIKKGLIVLTNSSDLTKMGLNSTKLISQKYASQNYFKFYKETFLIPKF